MKYVKFQMFWIICFVTHGLLVSSALYGRDVFLNGSDISSVHNQVLENVTVNIDDKGNVLIEAPHYQVQEEKSYEPLGKPPKSKMDPPEHKPVAPLPPSIKSDKTAEVSADAPKTPAAPTLDTTAPTNDKTAQAMPTPPKKEP